MLKGFRDFILRGNIVDLAVGVVIGVAFTDLVKQFTASFLEPLLKRIGGGEGTFAGSLGIGGGQHLAWAAFLNTVISFLITAAVLYFLVILPMSKLTARFGGKKEKETAEEIRLLREIRDALTARDREQALPRPRTDA